MALKLNTLKEYIQTDGNKIPFYKEFYGRNTEQMPKLIADGRVPMSVAGLMQRRIDVRNSDNKVKSSYMNNYFDTGDGVIYHPDGRVKIVLDSQHLRDMTPKSPRNGGALILGEDVYNALDGEEFKKGKLGKTGDWMSKADVKSHPVWKVLARDQGLLNDYTDYIFAEGKHDSAMGIFPGSANGETPEMRAWFVYNLEYRSSAYGRYVLVYVNGRLLGIAPEKVIEGISKYTIADLQAFDKSIKGLEAFVKPELLEGIRGFRKKL